MKHIILSLFLLFSSVSHADEALNHAIKGQAADVLSTGIALSTGKFVEANPLGLSLLIIKPASVYFINGLEEPSRTHGLHAMSSVGYAAAASNFCMMLIEPSSVAGCLIFGSVLGYFTYQSLEENKDVSSD